MNVNVDAEPSVFAVSAGFGGGPRVIMYNPDGSVRHNFFAYDPQFTGGVAVALADVNGDGMMDVIVGQIGGGSQVRVYDAATLGLVQTLAPFGDFNDGARVAAADLNGDGVDDILIGAGSADDSDYRVFSGQGVKLFDRTAFGGYNGIVNVA